MSAFDDCLNGFTWLPENDGQPAHNTGGDAGGLTAWGVTQHTWAAWASMHVGLPAFVSMATQAALADVLRAWFWNSIAGDSLPKPVALMVFDFGVTAGPGTAARKLQMALNVAVDGQIGPKTLAAAAAADPAQLCQNMHDVAAHYYAVLPGAVEFGDGWARRNDARLALALSWCG